ncbi:MAG: hypothetical protein Q9224_006034 [Gallowayella concinna]
MTFSFDLTHSLRAIDVYATAIDTMYHLAINPFLSIVRPIMAVEVEGYNVLILFINLQPPEAPNQLKIAHCVAALYRAVNVMTDGVAFNELRCDLKINTQKIGALSIAPLTLSLDPTPTTNATFVNDDREFQMGPNASAVGGLGVLNGQITDTEHPEFAIKFQFYGKPIKSKEVALVILEALATSAPFNKNTECKEIEALSSNDECIIIIEKVDSPANSQKFTYGWAIRTLKLLFERIIVPHKRFGDLYLEMSFNGHKFGELRLLKITGATGARNTADVAA